MGIVVNGATDIGVSIGKASAGVGNGAKCPLHMVSKPNGDMLTKNASGSLNLGSQACGGLSECRDLATGLSQGDLTNGALNAGLLSLYCVAGGASNGAMKIGGSQAASSGLAKAAALGASSKTLQNTIQGMPEQGNSSDVGSQELGNNGAETGPLGSSSTDASNNESSSSKTSKNDEANTEETAGGEEEAAENPKTRQTSMLSIGIIGVVTGLGMGFLGFRGEGEILGQIFGQACMSAGQRSLFAPLELVRLRLQTQNPYAVTDDVKGGVSDQPTRYAGVIDCCRQVYQQEGLLGFWKGNVCSLFTFLPNYVLDHSLGHAFDAMKAAYGPMTPMTLQVAEALTATLLPAASLLIVQPLEMLRDRLAGDRGTGEAKKYKGILDCLNQIVEKEGFKGIYKNFFISFAALMIFKVCFNGLNNEILTYLTDPDELTKYGVAAVSSLIAGLTSYPLDTIKSKLALEAGTEDPDYDGVLDAAKKIFTEEDFSAFFRGAQVKLLYIPIGLAPFGFAALNKALGLNLGLGQSVSSEAPPIDTIVNDLAEGLETIEPIVQQEIAHEEVPAQVELNEVELNEE